MSAARWLAVLALGAAGCATQEPESAAAAGAAGGVSAATSELANPAYDCVQANGKVKPDGTGCNDKNPCTKQDRCQSGVCVGTKLVDGKGCDDGLACTTGDSCLAGTCTGTSTCGDDNGCTDDACTAAGCAHTPNSAPCGGFGTCHGAVCHYACPSGCCTPQPKPLCGDPAVEACVCAFDSYCCDIQWDGLCANEASQCGASCGNPCEDANMCTVDTCSELGGCAHAPAQDVCHDANPCTVDTCDVAAAACAFLPAEEGASCGTTAACHSGLCLGPPGACSSCCQDSQSAGCDDAGVQDAICAVDPFCCQVRWDGICVNEVSTVAGGSCVSPCDDGNLCTTDSCTDQNNGCTHGEVSCDDGSDCTADLCDPSFGCQHIPDPCDDANLCTYDYCGPMGCEHFTACDDWNPCTEDTCDPAVGCQYSPVKDGSSCPGYDPCSHGGTCQAGFCDAPFNSCEDGNLCTYDYCGPMGCEHFTGCDDGNSCTEDTCDPAVGCQFAPVQDGTTCTGYDPCSPGGTCQAGVCNAPFTSCEDGDPCTKDYCGPMGCEHYSYCQDGDPCTDDACDSATGGCVFTPAQDGAPCGANDPCTTPGVCKGGGCFGAVSVCDDGDPCTWDLCNPDGSCVNIPGACSPPPPPPPPPGQCLDPSGNPLPEGAWCEDGDPCTKPDMCQKGVCVSGPKVCP